MCYYGNGNNFGCWENVEGGLRGKEGGGRITEQHKQWGEGLVFDQHKNDQKLEWSAIREKRSLNQRDIDSELKTKTKFWLTKTLYTNTFYLPKIFYLITKKKQKSAACIKTDAIVLKHK